MCVFVLRFNIDSIAIVQLEEMPGLMALGMQDYYPYVFFKLNINMIDGKTSD